jgi:hypothetical protein
MSVLKQKYKCISLYIACVIRFKCLNPLSTTFQLYRDSKRRELDESTNLPFVTSKYYHIKMYRVHIPVFRKPTNNFCGDKHELPERLSYKTNILINY